MKQAEFVTLIKAGAVESVWFHPDADGSRQGWTVGVSAPGYRPDSGARYWIEPARETTARLWASLDTLHAWVLSLGYEGPISIDA